MVDTPSQAESAPAPSQHPVKDAEGLIRAIGLVFSNTFLYGAQHGVTTKALEDCYTRLGGALAETGEVMFQITDAGVTVNGEPVELKNPLARMFVTHLTEINVNNFTIARGLSHEKFAQLMEIMNAKPEELQQLGGFAAFAASVGITEIKVRKVTIQHVEEGEEVVDKSEIAEKEAVVEAAKSVETIMAFLRGEVNSDDPALQAGLQNAPPDAKKLGELILRAAEIKRAAETSGGENFADIVVGCLRRVHEGMAKSPAARSQKGKKALSKSLMLLEKEVLDKMREMAGKTVPADEETIHDVVEELTDELAVDGLASEYMKRRDAIESSENRILRYIKKKGLESLDETDLQERLAESGLTPEGWQELLVKSRAAAGGGGGGGGGDGGAGPGGAAAGLAALGNIAMLLAELEKRVETSKATGEAAKVEDIAKNVGMQVSQATQATETKIDNLGKEIEMDQETIDRIEKEAAGSGSGLHMPRRKLLSTLAEIGQELCQPLSVVNCSLEMMMSQNIGSITPQQRSIVELAATSAERLRVLVEDLKGICGMPDTMSPDDEITNSLYKKKT